MLDIFRRVMPKTEEKGTDI